MHWAIEPSAFALVGFQGPPLPEDLEELRGEGPAQIVREGGETTILAVADACDRILERHPAGRSERPLVWIRFEYSMGWEVVGFLALVTGALAEAGVPLGAVCGFSRDHLFLGERHRAKAVQVLGALFGPPQP
ncbi:hypothetical protein Pla86_40130 [Planctomycetes bacterium Pla86]|uniref:Aspartate kinase n=2 Tax=Engelhardtia mirabilis TaxID=2528011 RepID=A0A518BPJ9_9BACT|nr:hypothetical protein Pla133_40140 [Planctomycetes bacterium Pla133]QDV03226.1 hypothetical protein Pla86_40130 [Planctomycetes bacterium Pla86]